MKARAKGDTKNRILTAALAEIAASPDSSVSFGSVARNLGISKTTVFRYYEDKAALDAAMRGRFFDDLALALTESAKVPGVLKSHELVRRANRFLLTRPEYLGLIKNLCSESRGINVVVSKAFQERGITPAPLWDHCPHLGSGPLPEAGGEAHFPEGAASQVYCFTTIIYFMLQYRVLTEKDAGEKGRGKRRAQPFVSRIPPDPGISPEDFADRLSEFLLAGWTEMRELGAEEMAEAEARSAVDARSLPEENRFFQALVQVIFAHGFSGITMERIADELGMAKSSIYAFFENKDALMNGLIKREVTYLIAALSERLSGLTDAAMAVFTFLHTIYNYVAARPALLAVIVWHFMHGGDMDDLTADFIHGNLAEDISDGLRLLSEYEKPDLGVKLPLYARSAWLAALPVALLLSGRRHLGEGENFFGDPKVVHRRITEMYHWMGRSMPDEDAMILRKP